MVVVKGNFNIDKTDLVCDGKMVPSFSVVVIEWELFLEILLFL